MKRHLIKSLINFLVLVISIISVSLSFAQEKQKIPADFFMGKWGGNIYGEVVSIEPPIKYPFSD